jgi:paraquat-inducible protein A
MATRIACRICGQLQVLPKLSPGFSATCCRCGSLLAEHKTDPIRRTLALTVAALILYLPANIYPILLMDWHGVYSENTVWQGCVRLYQSGEWLVASVVLFASIVIPMIKLLGLLFLVAASKFNLSMWRKQRYRIYRFIEVIGPWAMLDVFLLSILVALVKLGQLATILPGPGLLAFTALVVLTLLASASFDPRSIWDGTP